MVLSHNLINSFIYGVKDSPDGDFLEVATRRKNNIIVHVIFIISPGDCCTLWTRSLRTSKSDKAIER